MTRDDNMTDLPSDAAIAEALRLSGLEEWEVADIKEGWDELSTARAIIAFARYIEENAK